MNEKEELEAKDLASDADCTFREAFDLRLALQIYQDADAILHSRIQSYMLAQTFLVLSYATIIGNFDKHPLIIVVACAICASGLFSSLILSMKMQSINTKMRRIRTRLVDLPEYRFYFGRGMENATVKNNSFTESFPTVVNVTWVALLLLALGLLVHSSGGKT